MNAVATMLLSVASAAVMIFSSIASGYTFSSIFAPREISTPSHHHGRIEIAHLAIGFAINGFLFWLAGSLGWLGLLPWFLFALAIRGFFIARSRTFRILMPKLMSRVGALNQWLAGSVLLVWIALAGTTLYPHSHGDALYYHLSSAWIWARQGTITHIDWMPWYLQGGLGEYFYTGLATISYDRMAFVLSGQIVHFFFGYLLPILVIFTIARSLLQETEDEHRLSANQQMSLALLGTLAMSLIPQGLSFLTHAKNDGFVLLFETVSLMMLISHNSKTRAQSIVVAALALACKSSALFYLLPFGVTYLAALWAWDISPTNNFALKPPFIYRLASHLLPAIAIGLMVPVRNYILTGTPFFPAMTNLFPSPLIDSETQRIVAGFTKAPGTVLESVMSQGYRFIWSMPFFLLAVVGSLKFLKAPRVKVVSAIHFGALALYTLITGQGTAARFLFIAYGTGASLGALGGAATWSHLQRFFKNSRYGFSLWTGFILIVGIVPWSAAEVPFVHNVTRTLSFALSHERAIDWFAHKKSILPIQLWINEHRNKLDQGAGKPIKILSFLHNQNLFLDVPMSVPENDLGASKVKNASDYEGAISALCRGGFTHLLIEQEFLTGYMDQVTGNINFNREFPVTHEQQNFQLRVAKRCLPVSDSTQSIKPDASP